MWREERARRGLQARSGRGGSWWGGQGVGAKAPAIDVMADGKRVQQWCGWTAALCAGACRGRTWRLRSRRIGRATMRRHHQTTHSRRWTILRASALRPSFVELDTVRNSDMFRSLCNRTTVDAIGPCAQRSASTVASASACTQTKTQLLNITFNF